MLRGGLSGRAAAVRGVLSSRTISNASAVALARPASPGAAIGPYKHSAARLAPRTCPASSGSVAAASHFPLWTPRRTLSTSAPSGGHVVELRSVRDFDQAVLRDSGAFPVIVDCYADWCGPCKRLTPLLERAVASYSGAPLRLAKLNVDNAQLVGALQELDIDVSSVPTVLVFLRGGPAPQLAFRGLQPEHFIRMWMSLLAEQAELMAAAAAKPPPPPQHPPPPPPHQPPPHQQPGPQGGADLARATEAAIERHVHFVRAELHQTGATLRSEVAGLRWLLQRSYNKDCQDGSLVPLLPVCNGQGEAPPHAVRSRADFERLAPPQLDALLAHYGLQSGGSEGERRRRLRAHCGYTFL